jgi:hypothetical protein
LVALRRPKKKCLLRQIRGVSFGFRQAERKTKQRRVLPIHQLLKIDAAHIATRPEEFARDRRQASANANNSSGDFG